MKGYVFDISTPVKMGITGKFQAPSPEWVHLTRYLIDYELIVMTSGTLYMACDQTHYTVSEGEFLLLPPYTNQHGFKPSNCSFYWMHFSPEHDLHATEMSEMPSPPTYGKIILPEVWRPYNHEKVIVMMKQLQDSVISYHETNLNNYFATTILCELHNQCVATHKSGTSHKKEQLYNDIVNYVRRNLNQNILVSDIANQFGYNEKYLTSAFKKLSGISLKQYVVKEKIEHAKFILIDTNNTIQEIAMQVGYKDSHVFMKSFKRTTGLTPSEYRNAYSKRLMYNK